MSNNEDRVLGRLGAHELTRDELQNIVGGGSDFNTLLSVIFTLPVNNPDHHLDS